MFGEKLEDVEWEDAKMTDIPDKEQWDASTLVNAFNCKRAFYWSRIRGVGSIDDGISKVYGIAWHVVLAGHYNGWPLGKILASIDDTWEKYQVEPDKKRNPKRLAEQYADYLREFPQESFEVLAVEATGAFPIGDFLYVVIIDLLTKVPNYGVVPVDHKTSTRLKTDYMAGKWWRESYPNLQYTGYVRAAHEFFPADKTYTLSVNASLVDETLSKFERKPIVFHPADLDDWERDVISLVHELRYCKEINHWPKNTDYCQRWGCEYHPLCTTSGVDYRQIEPSPELYKPKTWDPLREER